MNQKWIVCAVAVTGMMPLLRVEAQQGKGKTDNKAKNEAKAATVPIANAQRKIVLYDSSGKMLRTLGEPGLFNQPQYSPDGKRITIVKDSDIWVYDIASGKSTQITKTPSPEAAPYWSPDGKTLAYAAVRDNLVGLYRKPADGSGMEQTVKVQPFGVGLNLAGWTRSGVAFWAASPATNSDIWLMPMDGKGDARPLVQTPANEQAAKVSRDERWVAYRSNESGKNEIYLRPFAGGAATKVSSAGGEMAKWLANSQALLYSDPTGKVSEVPVGKDGKLGAAKAALQFPSGYATTGNPGGAMDMRPDGKEYLFLMQ